MYRVLRHIRSFGEHALKVGKRKHFRSVCLMSANGFSDVPAIMHGLVSTKDTLQGGCIAEFEALFSRVMGGGYAVSFGSGRVALAAILDALEIGPDDEVMMPGYTCVVVPNPVLYRGARPVYADIDKRTLNLDPKDVKRKITSKTRAIIVQHTFGMPCDFDAIAQLARPLGIRLIEDCTHALGAKYVGQPVGTLGDAAYFSMEQSKLISTGMGGVAFTRNEELAPRLAEFQRQRCVWPEPAEVRLTLSYLLYLALLRGPRSIVLGDLLAHYLYRLRLMKCPEYTAAELQCRCPPSFLKRLPNAYARVAISQLRHLARNLARRNAVAQAYNRRLPKCGFEPPAVPEGCEPVYLRYPLWVDDKSALVDYLAEREIGIGVWFDSTIHPRVVRFVDAHYKEGSCPNAESAVRHIVNLPSHPRMNSKDAMRVAAALATYREEHLPWHQDTLWLNVMRVAAVLATYREERLPRQQVLSR